MTLSADPRREAARQLFAEWEQAPAEDRDARFDALCVQHPDLAEHLHRLRLAARQAAPSVGNGNGNGNGNGDGDGDGAAAAASATPGSERGRAANGRGTVVLPPEHEVRSALEIGTEGPFAATTTDPGGIL